ncbi:MAG: hypothetical protein J5786_00195 [Clostridiales bacterium]|nr:hypothetical protein [Clostridiales bacterium]
MENENLDNNTYEVDTQPEIVGNAVLYSVLAYFGILFLVGLLAAPEKDTPFVKNHVNNGIVLFGAGVILSILAGLSALIWILIPIVSIISIGLLILSIMGIVKAVQKETFSMPLIGDKITVVK